jgi:hypothetical protein
MMLVLLNSSASQDGGHRIGEHNVHFTQLLVCKNGGNACHCARRDKFLVCLSFCLNKLFSYVISHYAELTNALWRPPIVDSSPASPVNYSILK